MKFTFGADWSDNNEGEIDIDVEYILRMRVYNQTHDPLDILGYFYDEIPIKEGINLELHDDTLYGEIKYLQMNIHDRYGQNSYPKFASDAMNISRNEYSSFLTDFSLTLNNIKQHYNDVILRNGVPFPYDVPEFYTTLKFYPGAAYFLFETLDEFKQTAFNSARYFGEDMDEEENPYLDDDVYDYNFEPVVYPDCTNDDSVGDSYDDTCSGWYDEYPDTCGYYDT